jgi:NADPH:quinone reductase-like Zn-dependent oxidoreductase
MKAVICPKYGPPEVLQLREIEKPSPKSNEVLIKNHATTVLLGDCELRGLNFPHYSLLLKFLMRFGFGIRGPRKKILGQQLAGEIEAIGQDVSRFKEGEQVYAVTGLDLGAYAEYKCLREDAIMALKPVNMSFAEASTIPIGGLEALYFMRNASIQNGHSILINGAGGSIGTIAVQLAKYYRAEVTAVDSAAKFHMLRSLGAEQVIDYRQENFVDHDDTYDFIFDIVGVTRYSDCMRLLNENGVYLQGNGFVSRGDKSRANEHNRMAMDGPADYTIEGLLELKDLIEAGKIRTAIDRTYKLEQMVEAHRFVEQGGKLGNVVVTME